MAKNARRHLVDNRVDQARVMHFPEGWRSAYEFYSRVYQPDNKQRPISIKQVIRQMALLTAWFAVLTTFFVVERQFLSSPKIAAAPFANNIR